MLNTKDILSILRTFYNLRKGFSHQRSLDTLVSGGFQITHYLALKMGIWSEKNGNPSILTSVRKSRKERVRQKLINSLLKQRPYKETVFQKIEVQKQKSKVRVMIRQGCLSADAFVS